MNSTKLEIRPLALVTGITGGVGAAAAQALAARGWRIRALHRDPSRARSSYRPLRGSDAVEWCAGDALDSQAVQVAAAGARIIFHGVNPPRYQKWREWALPMLRNAIDAARTSGARLIFPGNVYNFGADAGTTIDEHAPQRPSTRKGAIRVEMESLMQEAAARHRVRSMVIRAGDFFGPTAPASWLASAIVKPGRPVTAIRYPGNLETGHTWAYLPDLGETIARLADQSDAMADFEVFHFGGHWIERGAEFCDAVRRAGGNPGAPIAQFPWWLIRAGSPMVGLFRELLEMRYLWDEPLRLDNRKLRACLDGEPHTPLPIALGATLAALGCVPAPRELVPARDAA